MNYRLPAGVGHASVAALMAGVVALIANVTVQAQTPRLAQSAQPAQSTQWAQAATSAQPAQAAHPPDATFATKSMTPEIALAATRAALESCRKSGHQVAVAVVDRAGVPQALLRDRFAGAHTPHMAMDKAWTSASFKITTQALATETQAGRPMSGIRALPRVIAAGGGVPIEAGGSLLGAIGVSGAPGGEADEACARAGIKAIADQIEF